MIFIYINYYIVLLLIKKFNINDKIIYIKKINKKIWGLGMAELKFGI